MSEAIDRRVRKTKKQLRQGLAELLKEKPVSSITVREISDLVDINRGTFYLHYKDIFDMVEQIQSEMFEEFNAIIEAHRDNRMRAEPLPMLIDIFTYLSENAEMAQVLMSKNGDAAFIERLKSIIKEICFYDWSLALKIKDERAFSYGYAYIVSGCIGIFQLWLANGRKETAAEMAAIAEKIITKGISVIM